MPEYVAEISLGSYSKLHVRAASPDELVEALTDLAVHSPLVVDNMNAVSSAGKAVVAPAANIDRPSGAATAEPGSGGAAPKCDCGIKMNDCQGKRTKAGAAYKYRWYPACKNQECKPA